MEFIYKLFTDYVSEVEDVPMEHDDPPPNNGCVIA